MKSRFIHVGTVLFLLFAAPFILINGRVYHEKKEYAGRMEFDFNVTPMEQTCEVVLQITYRQLTRSFEGKYQAVLIYPSGRRDSRLFTIPRDTPETYGGKNWADGGDGLDGNTKTSRAHIVKLFDVGEENGEHRVIVKEKNSASMKGICMTVSVWVDQEEDTPDREEPRDIPWI